MFTLRSKNNVSLALKRYEKPLVRYARAIVGPTLAPDVVQDTFLKLCAHEEELGERLAPWLYTVCRNRAIDMRRKSQRHMELPEQLELPTPAVQDVKAERKQLLLKAMDALRGLSEQKREVMLLKFGSDLSYKEISEVTGLTVSHVGVILHETLKQLRQKLRERPGQKTPPTPKSGRSKSETVSAETTSSEIVSAVTERVRLGEL